MERRYLLLAGDTYYPTAWGDFRGRFASIEDALKGAFDAHADWFEVIDLEDDTVVSSGGSRA